MVFDAADPRTQLTSIKAAAVASAYGPSSYIKFYETEPQLEDASSRTWIGRGAYFVVAYTEASAEATFVRESQPDEYMVLLPDAEHGARVSTALEELSVPGGSVVIVPPGPSSITVPRGGRLVRIFSHLAADLIDLSANAAAYEREVPNLPDYVPWPESPDGHRVRFYSLGVEPAEGRFGRIWRCSTLMINYSYPRQGPRDVRKMSPHAHEDFEQASLVLDGSFVHHLRYPWTVDMRTWREDEHEICAGPSLAVIPAQAVHTSQQVGRDTNQLVDIFAPPRMDFSRLSGWVLNGDEYPMPEDQS